MSSEQPRINTDLAQWFRSADRARRVCRRGRFYRRTIEEAFGSTPTLLLELGSGGSNNAFHYKRRVPRSTLTDLSPAMLGLSRQVNPELEHIEGDMRTLRLGREFDAV